MTPSALSNETQRAIAIIHWVFSADGTKGERSMADEAINKISDPSFMPLITELQSYRSEGVTTVKPLEWERTPGGAWEATPPYWADGYLVAEQIDDGGWYASDPESETLASGVTLREAKEACQIDFSERILATLQLDYESRIKSALLPSTERGETIEACARIAEDYAERHRYVGPDANLRIAAAIRALNPSGSGERG